MKKISKILVCLVLGLNMILPAAAFGAGGTFEVNCEVSEVEIGETFEILVGGDCCGRVDLTVENGTLSENKIWVEEGFTSVQVTAGDKDKVIVTASPYEGFSDLDAELYEPDPITLTVAVPGGQPTGFFTSQSGASWQLITGAALLIILVIISIARRKKKDKVEK